MQIPLSVEYTGQEEQAAVAQALQSRSLVGNGRIGKAVEGQIAELFGVRHVLLTTSCTHALEIAMIALDLGPGDEVIMPSFTFVSTANSVVLRGATPVFADIDPATLNIDPDDVRRRITPRTRAIVPVHYAGVGCEMDALMAIAAEHSLAVIEDAAQAVDARYKGSYLGTIGRAGCYSFHSTKNIVCGEGGALVTNDDALAERALIIREKGTNRSAFIRGLVDKYSWVGAGSSYVLSDLLAAVLQTQLAKRDAIRGKRGAIWNRYAQALVPLANEGRISLPHVPNACDQNYHIFYFRLNDGRARDAVLAGLHEVGVRAAFHFVPLHSAPFGTQQGWHRADLRHTEVCSQTLIRLPLFPGLTEQQVEYVLHHTQRLVRQHTQARAVRPAPIAGHQSYKLGA